MHIHFVLIGEGTSDNGLIPHLEKLCIDTGADEVSGTSPDFERLPVDMHIGHRVEARIKATLALEPNANLIFIHRNADSTDPEPRYDEISKAIELSGSLRQHVAIVPAQETEAWLLLDENAIRQISQKPRGVRPLRLPRPARVEAIAQPKERLERALIDASELTGRRLNRFTKRFSMHRQLLLQRLPVGGPLYQLPSWVRLRGDLEHAIAMLNAHPI